jgi:undecaprenyl pyrophosphate phosphatase UppP
MPHSNRKDIFIHTACEFLPISSSWFFQKKSFETILWYHFCVGVGVFIAFYIFLVTENTETNLFLFVRVMCWRYFWINLPLLVVGSIFLKNQDDSHKVSVEEKNIGIYVVSTFAFLIGCFCYYFGYVSIFLKNEAHTDSVIFLCVYGCVQALASSMAGISRLGMTTILLILLGFSLSEAFLNSFLYAIPVLIIPTLVLCGAKSHKMIKALREIGLFSVVMSIIMSFFLFYGCFFRYPNISVFLFVSSIIFRCVYVFFLLCALFK